MRKPFASTLAVLAVAGCTSGQMPQQDSSVTAFKCVNKYNNDNVVSVKREPNGDVYLTSAVYGPYPISSESQADSVRAGVREAKQLCNTPFG